MNYATIKKHDVANGVGVRVSLFVSGCTHRCKGCFNAEAWDFSFGKEFTEETNERSSRLWRPLISRDCPCWAANRSNPPTSARS